MSLPVPSLRPRPEAERQRIYESFVDLAGERGLGRITPEQVVERAGLSREVFSRHFSDLDDCFAEYIIEASGPLIADAREALASADGWRPQLRGVIYEMVRFFRADEARANMLLVETHAAGPRAGLVRDQLLESLVDLIDHGRLLMEDPSSLTRVTAEAMAGALLNQMHLLMQKRCVDDELVPQLLYFLVLPYLGVEAAQEEFSPPSLPEP